MARAASAGALSSASFLPRAVRSFFVWLPMKKSPVEKMTKKEVEVNARTVIPRLRLLAFMLRSDRPFTTGEVAKSYECSRKTIVRDLALLAQLGYEFAFDYHQNRYRLSAAPAPAL